MFYFQYIGKLLRRKKKEMEKTEYKLKQFLIFDFKVKKTMLEMNPRNINNPFDQEEMVKYIDKWDDILEDWEENFSKYTQDFDLSKNLIKYIKNIFTDYKKDFFNCKTNIDKITKWYEKNIIDVDASTLKLITSDCMAYTRKKDISKGTIKSINSINELLHLIHARIFNDECIYHNIPALEEKKLSNNESVYLRGEENKIARNIFASLPNELDVKTIDILSFSADSDIYMLVNGVGHATSIIIEKEDGKYYIRYTIPKLCNTDMINSLKGVDRVYDNAPIYSGTSGFFETNLNDIYFDLTTLISNIPSDKHLKLY